MPYRLTRTPKISVFFTFPPKSHRLQPFYTPWIFNKCVKIPSVAIILRTLEIQSVRFPLLLLVFLVYFTFHLQYPGDDKAHQQILKKSCALIKWDGQELAGLKAKRSVFGGG